MRILGTRARFITEAVTCIDTGTWNGRDLQQAKPAIAITTTSSQPLFSSKGDAKLEEEKEEICPEERYQNFRRLLVIEPALSGTLRAMLGQIERKASNKLSNVWIQYLTNKTGSPIYCSSDFSAIVEDHLCFFKEAEDLGFMLDLEEVRKM